MSTKPGRFTDVKFSFLKPTVMITSGLNTNGSAATTSNQSGSNAMMNLLLNAANSSTSSTPSASNVFGSSNNSSQQQQSDQESNGNVFQQLFSGSSGFPFGNMTFQQILATAALSQLASENAKN
uniref:Uncharacterized protein n=1 Tax=Ditylenchus dipsaci TaxID=166011 RepID=A0A915D5N8_9BILA